MEALQSTKQNDLVAIRITTNCQRINTKLMKIKTNNYTRILRYITYT